MYAAGLLMIVCGVALLTLGAGQERGERNQEVARLEHERLYYREWTDETGQIRSANTTFRVGGADPGPPLEEMRKRRGLE